MFKPMHKKIIAILRKLFLLKCPYAFLIILCLFIFSYVYAIGGQDGTEVLSTVERFDLHTNTWTLVAPLPQPLRFMTSVSYKGKLFVFGGEGTTDVTRAAYRYTNI